MVHIQLDLNSGDEKMKRIVAFVIISLMMFTCVACGEETITMVPQVSDMRAICELATMDCYYHNVAKYNEENAESFLWFTKDKHFWIEYAGVVTLGVDVAKIKIEVLHNKVTITIPAAEVLSCKVDEATLTEDSFIVAKNSADVTAEDQTNAFKEAQSQMLEKASKDTVLLVQAQQRVQLLLEDYVQNIGNTIGMEYEIEWIYLENEIE